MTTGTLTTGGRLRWVVSDALILARRNLLKYRRVPTLLMFSTIQPVMFVLLFNYVFGGAISTAVESVVPISGLEFNYIDFLLAGIMIQAAVFGSTQTGVGLAEDMKTGLIDRFRSLPMSRSAVLAGRTMGDSVRNMLVILLMVGVGYLIGFRFRGGLFYAVMAVLLAVAFGLAFSWISATIGLTIKDVEATQAASFVWVFPLVFASSAFVPTASMPAWLEAFANVNPVTVTVNAIRGFTLGFDPWPDFWKSLAWIVGILVVFVPLAVRRYRRAV
jgi:ABC-2 type transport system permease protein/oleandomycin transport system permease protein